MIRSAERTSAHGITAIRLRTRPRRGIGAAKRGDHMISFISRVRAAWTFGRHQCWVNPLPWRKEDANALSNFFKSDSGKRFKDALLNTVLMQNASAITDRNHLQYSSGFAMGQASLVKVIEMMADQESITGQEDDPDSATNT